MDVFISRAISAGASPSETLKEVFIHQEIRRWSSTAINELSPEWLRQQHESTLPGEIFVIGSEVEDEGGRRWHLPMLDFSLESDERNDIWVCEALALVGEAGIVVDSGNSYHFYGSRLLGDEAFREFLGSALLFGGIIDRRWIAHQLIEGRAALRLGGGSSADMRIVARLDSSASSRRKRA